MENAVLSSFSLPKLTVLSVLLNDHEWGEIIEEELKKRGYRYTVGKVGSMELKKVIASIEIAAKSKGVINDGLYRESHALYHAIIEAVQGIGRGTVQIGDLLRTVGLTFTVVRGEMAAVSAETEMTNENTAISGEWISVCLFGTIGGLRKGFEHEVIGFGVNHI